MEPTLQEIRDSLNTQNCVYISNMYDKHIKYLLDIIETFETDKDEPEQLRSFHNSINKTVRKYKYTRAEG